MFPNVYFICMEHRLRVKTNYSNIHRKMLPKQQMQKSKLALPKPMAKKFFWLLQKLIWWRKSFKDTSTAIKTIQGYQVDQIIPRQIHQWKISHQA